MPHTVSYNISRNDGTTRSVLIEPVLTQSKDNNVDFTGVYTIYEGNEQGAAHLLEIQAIAPEVGESLPLLDDNRNPEFLGRVIFNKNASRWEYTGGALSDSEQNQVIQFVQSGN